MCVCVVGLWLRVRQARWQMATRGNDLSIALVLRKYIALVYLQADNRINCLFVKGNPVGEQWPLEGPLHELPRNGGSAEWRGFHRQQLALESPLIDRHCASHKRYMESTMHCTLLQHSSHQADWSAKELNLGHFYFCILWLIQRVSTLFISLNLLHPTFLMI